MPPRASLTSFSITAAADEVVCPLHNQDGSSCRKRCLGEKRFRSMQEHIRRAHPEYYIPKLPATKESFELMINSPPHEVPPPEPNANLSHSANHKAHPPPHRNHQQQQHHHSDFSGRSHVFNSPDDSLSSYFEGYQPLGEHDGGYYTANDTEANSIYTPLHPPQQRSSDEFRRGSLIPAASAAAALAQLHHYGSDQDWGGDSSIGQNFYADSADIKPPSFNVDPALEDHGFLQDQEATFPTTVGGEQPRLLPSSLARPSSPSERPTALASLQRSLSSSSRPPPTGRPRKPSLTQQGRMPKHERKKSKDVAKRSSGDRKAFGIDSGNPASVLGKRWEDLIDAAASATEEEGSRDLTPIPASPYQSPQVLSRTSLPPFALGSQFQSFQASPLNRALTPPPAHHTSLDLQSFPSVESNLGNNHTHHHQHHDSVESGSQFHIMHPSSIDSTSSPLFTPASGNAAAVAAGGPNPLTAAATDSSAAPGMNGGINHHQSQQNHHHPASNSASSASPVPVQIYCSGCRRLSILKDSFACTICICGLCGSCTDAIQQEQSRGRMSTCPSCHAMDSSFKRFKLDLR